MPASERGTFDTSGLADPVHAEVSEIIVGRIPCHQIPQRLQDQHGLRFDLSACFGPLASRCWDNQIMATAQVKAAILQANGGHWLLWRPFASKEGI
jgi:hypothetical protein